VRSKVYTTNAQNESINRKYGQVRKKTKLFSEVTIVVSGVRGVSPEGEGQSTVEKICEKSRFFEIRVDRGRPTEWSQRWERSRAVSKLFVHQFC